MTYEEFEWKILRVVYEDGINRFRASELSFSFGLSIEKIEEYLELAVQAKILDLELGEDGVLEYFVPGIKSASGGELKNISGLNSENLISELEIEGADGSVQMHGIANSSSRSLAQERVEKHGIDGGIKAKKIIVFDQRTKSPHAYLHPEAYSKPTTELVSYLPQTLRENHEATFSNASRTMYRRTIRIYGDQSHEEIHYIINHAFTSFGYRPLKVEENKIRFERGSAFFLIALIPLFVLIVPMIIYLMLSIMGRSTIEKEPIILDVAFEQKNEIECYWEVDFTFLGLHGVILGKADRKILNEEIDALKIQCNALAT